MRTPAAYAQIEATNCPASFCQGFRHSQSSSTPVMKISATGGEKPPDYRKVVLRAGGQGKKWQQGVYAGVRNQDRDTPCPRRGNSMYLALVIRPVDQSYSQGPVPHQRSQQETQKASQYRQQANRNHINPLPSIGSKAPVVRPGRLSRTPSVLSDSSMSPRRLR